MTDWGGGIRIFDIQQFSVHDGPGIRTTVFLKGCHMFCPWCANPESQRGAPDLLYFESKCVSCGCCAAVCPVKAIDFSVGKPVFDRTKCIGCGRCAENCTQYALKLSGKTVSASEIMNVVRRDREYYDNTGGGMTLSGGEPLCQPEASAALLRAAKAEGIHTAVETAASVPPEAFDWVLADTDLFLLDVKFADPEKLKRVTGADLNWVRRNLEQAVRRSRVIVRIPVIPGYNDTEAEIAGIFRLIKECGADRADLLAYHLLGKSKYTQLGRMYPCREAEALPKEQLEPYRMLGESMSISATIGGK